VDNEALSLRKGQPMPVSNYPDQTAFTWRGTSDELNNAADTRRTTCERLRTKSTTYRQDTILNESRTRSKIYEQLDNKIEATRGQIEELQTMLLGVEAGLFGLEQTDRNVKKSMEAKEDPLALAQTRMQVRSCRPGSERVMDPAHVQLGREAQGLDFALRRLHDEQGRIATERNSLETQLKELEQRMRDKQDAIDLEKEVQRQMQELRVRLTPLSEGL